MATDLSHWDFSEHFKAKEVAELIVGIPPEANTNLFGIYGDEVSYTEKITPVLRRMSGAFRHAEEIMYLLVRFKGETQEALKTFPFNPIALHSEFMVNIRNSGDEIAFASYSNFSDTPQEFYKVYFGRKEVHRWLTAIGMKSVYQFEVQKANSDSQTIAPQSEEKPLSKRERDTLLTIIAVLCKEAKLDYKTASVTADFIQSTAAGMKISIGASTIRDHLKKIPDALGTRTK